MDFAAKKGDLLRELQYVQGVVEKKTTVPILSNILLETTGNNLVLTATDLDVTIQCSCASSVRVSGATTVSARKLFDIVRLAPDSDMRFKRVDENWMDITCERSRFKIATLSKDNFPDIPSVEGGRVTLPASALRHMIARSIFAITQEESRFALSGALMIVQPGKLTLVTTDGHRLALIDHELKISGLETEKRNLVPRKTLVELSKLTTDDVSTVEFGTSENHLFFHVGDRLLVSRMLSGQFPNYELVIPRDNNKKVVISALDFNDALRRVSIMADERSKSVRFSLKEGQLEVSSNSAEFGEAKEVIPANYRGDPIAVCFNAGYFLDFLGGLESEEVVVELRDEETQGLLRPQTEGDYSSQYVIMPMKL